MSMSVDKYISQYDGETKKRLETMRALIRTEAPDAVESYSYGLNGYKLKHRPLVYVGGFKHHIGFYATPNGHEAFKEELSKYKQGKGSVQFPLDQPLPVELIRNMIRYRIRQVTDG